MTILTNNLVTIDTTVPTLSIGQIQLSADRRSTIANKLTDAERIRRAVLPAGHWGELASSINGQANQSLTDILRTALTAIASDRLRDTLAAEPMQRTIQLADYSIPALLAWNAETASGRGSITFTRDQVESWFDASATLRSLMTKWQATGKTLPQLAAMQQFVRNRFAALAAKNHGLKDEADALKLLTLLSPDDANGEAASLVTELTGRIEHIAKTLRAKAAEATISMDDL